MKRYAYRTIRLCTKDCLCLYVCPTGATDTEDSIIDTSRCIGCGMCADACPSAAISMVPAEMPAQQPKKDNVKDALSAIMKNKAEEENIASSLPDALGKAIGRSARLMGEDLNRESGYMLPQSKETEAFLKKIRDYPGIDTDTVDALLNTLPFRK